MEAPKTFDMITEVICKKNTKMYCLETQETTVVPAGTTVTRFRSNIKKPWYVYTKGDKNFEYDPRLVYLPIDGKFVKAVPVFDKK